MQAVEVRSRAYPSRWGFHPCDKATFLMLRRLFRAYMKALRGYHAWKRWQRKAPQNRVIRQWLRDVAGRKIGCTVVGPRQEPPLRPLFVRREMVKETYHEGRYYKDGVMVERVTLLDLGVELAYHLARYPVASEESVQPLGITTEEIQRMLAAIE